MKVAVIGSGVSGLAAARWLKEEGLTATIFEARAAIGGVWSRKETGEARGNPAYPGLSTNTSRQVSALSDMPYPKSDNQYPSREEVQEYLASYAQAHDLERLVRFEARVEGVVAAPDSRWRLTIATGDSRDDEDYDGVVVCTGRHQVPHWPALPGREGFRGRVLHSIGYTGPEAFRDQRVLLIGSGATAADLAVQISKTAQRVVVSARSGRWFIPRHLQGEPVDHRLTRALSLAPRRLSERLFRRAIWRELRAMGLGDGGRSMGVPVPDFDLKRIRLTLNTEFLLAAKRGALSVVPEVRTLGERDVEFSDGSREEVDAVIAATGYEPCFSIILDVPILTNDGDLDLYKYVFPPHVPGLGVVGAVIVQGPFAPVYEMQARWVARVFAGRASLPSGQEMRRALDERKNRSGQAGARRALVPYVGYMDEIAAEIGARPRLWRRPGLLPAVLLGPVGGAHYRLDGPHAWDGACDAIRHG